MAKDVAGLDGVIEVLEELHVTEYMGDPDCQQIGYARGSFVAAAGGDVCIANSELPPMDEQARVDHARVLAAFEAAGANTRTVVRIGYKDDVLDFASFFLDDPPPYEFYEYIYDPNGREPKVNDDGVLEYTRINASWWFVWSYFD